MTRKSQTGKNSSQVQEIRGAKPRSTRRRGWRIIIYSFVALVIVVICALFVVLTPVAPIAYRKAVRWWDEIKKTRTETNEERRAKRRVYLQQMEPPKLSGKEVAELLKKEKLIKTKELYDMADWYVYHGNKDVIRQVITNRQFEVKVTLPEDPGTGTGFDYTVAHGYCGPLWGTDLEVLIRHQELHGYAANKDTDPHFIYYLLHIMGRFKTEEYKLYYNQFLFYDDILAYLSIYANYKDWPSIRSECKRRIIEYPCVWHDRSTIEETLKIADEKGAEQAYELYMRRYRVNYQKRTGMIRNENDYTKWYKYETVFEGWSTQGISGRTRVYNVDSDQAVIAIKNVEKVISVLRDAEDITALCHVTAEKVMTVPLRAAKTVDLDYKISVAPEWWEGYYKGWPLRPLQRPDP